VITHSRAPRRVALVVGSATLLVLACAGPAAADIPVGPGWPAPPPVSVLRDLLLFIGIPLLITAAIFAAVYLPGVVRGESVAPAGARTDDQWFGGRRETAELESSTAGRAADETESARDTGGASGTW
jgi:hypothetical protein